METVKSTKPPPLAPFPTNSNPFRRQLTPDAPVFKLLQPNSRTAGGWGGAMVEDNIYQTSQYFDADTCYETTFADPEAEYFWSATVYNGDGRMFNDTANISSEMNPVKNANGTYTLRFGCESQPNNLPVAEGNTTGKFNVLMSHFGPWRAGD